MRRPLSQIRVSLVASLGAGQITFLTGSGAVENKVRREESLSVNLYDLNPNLNSTFSFLCFCAIFPNGRFLLDVDGGSLFLPVCCKSLQYQRQDEGFTWIFMG